MKVSCKPSKIWSTELLVMVSVFNLFVYFMEWQKKQQQKSSTQINKLEQIILRVECSFY